jgi:hypothetical protein
LAKEMPTLVFVVYFSDAQSALGQVKNFAGFD